MVVWNFFHFCLCRDLGGIPAQANQTQKANLAAIYSIPAKSGRVSHCELVHAEIVCFAGTTEEKIFDLYLWNEAGSMQCSFQANTHFAGC